MQENNKNASILILSIILSLILWVIFISLSNKISLNLRQNSNFIEKISNEEKIEKNLKLIENELKNILKEIKNQNPNQKNITKSLEEIDKNSFRFKNWKFCFNKKQWFYWILCFSRVKFENKKFLRRYSNFLKKYDKW